jgi:hypothetical protein
MEAHELKFGTERFEGKTVAIGGNKYIIPALSLGPLKRLRERIRKVTTGDATEEEAQEVTSQAIYAALKRNYPEITLEFVEEEIVDLVNCRQLLGVVLNASGYVKAGQGNAAAADPPTSTS